MTHTAKEHGHTSGTRTILIASTSTSGRPSTPPLDRGNIWYQDGSIILQVEKKYYRVHLSILAEHSAVFRDMFTIGEPDGELTYEGCPIVFLSDNAQDLEYLLRAIYNPYVFLIISQKLNQESTLAMAPLRPTFLSRFYPFFRFREPGAKTFGEVAALVRLGRKYQIDRLLNEAVSRITSEFPNTLEKWDSRQIGSQITLHRSTYVDCINLCREVGLLSPLPTALYGWMHYLHDTKRLQEIFKGVAKPDGITAVLSVEDQQLSVTSMEKLLQTQWIAFGWLNTEVQGCMEPDKCRQFRSKMKDKLSLPSPKLSGMRKSLLPNSFSRGLCEFCANHANEAYEWGRREIWTHLPRNFGLLPWEQLNTTLL